MAERRRRDKETREARENGSQVTSRADIETEFVERADESLRNQENTTKAFNLLWREMFQTVAVLTSVVSLWYAYKAFSIDDYPLFLFHAVGFVVFFSARQWLRNADITLENPVGLIGDFNFELRIFVLTATVQFLILPSLLLLGNAPAELSKLFPTGTIFLTVSLAVVGYMRYSLRSTIKMRAELTKKLFG